MDAVIRYETWMCAQSDLVRIVRVLSRSYKYPSVPCRCSSQLTPLIANRKNASTTMSNDKNSIFLRSSVRPHF